MYCTQALANAESAYAHAMTVVCSIPLPGECDGDAMKATLNAFSTLPQVSRAATLQFQQHLVLDASTNQCTISCM